LILHLAARLSGLAEKGEGGIVNGIFLKRAEAKLSSEEGDDSD
jgi:hypothetical protein